MHHRSGRRFMGKIPNAKSVTCRRRAEAQLARLTPCAGISARRFAELDPMWFESGHGRRSCERTVAPRADCWRNERRSNVGLPPSSRGSGTRVGSYVFAAETDLAAWRPSLFGSDSVHIRTVGGQRTWGGYFGANVDCLKRPRRLELTHPWIPHGALSSTHRSCVREA
jgi:hypothetical protein